MHKAAHNGPFITNTAATAAIDYVYGSGRLENRSSLDSDLASINPTHVFNAASVTGRPNVDWCESHKVETIRTNVVGTLTLADLCRDRGLLLINYATGCIFQYDSIGTLAALTSVAIFSAVTGMPSSWRMRAGSHVHELDHSGSFAATEDTTGCLAFNLALSHHRFTRGYDRHTRDGSIGLQRPIIFLQTYLK